MRIILLQDVPKVGKKWEVKNVADGFAQNSLIPRGLAEIATAAGAARAAAARADADSKRIASAEAIAQNFKKIEGARVEIISKANEHGHLFAAIHENDIIKALKEKTGVEVAPEFINLAHPIKTTWEHNIEVSVGDVKAHFTLSVSGN